MENGHINKESGFTLIEILIYSSIAAMILVAVMYNFIAANKSYHNTTININEIRQARDSLDRICEDLKYASNVKIFSTKNGIKSFSYGTDSISHSIYLGVDKLIYKKTGTNPAVPLIDIPVSNFSCSFNSSDSSNRTIDIQVKFSDNTKFDTSIHTLNISGTNEYQ